MLGSAAVAQTPEWPQAKPITCIVPFTAGGSTDVVGRTIGQTLQEALKQTGVVDNKPGQGGASARASSPRPHRMATRSSAARSARTPSTPACIKKLSYDPVKDFAPVALVAFLPNVRLVDPNLGVNNVVELIALLKKDEKKRTFASSGAGTSTHLAGEMFADLMGVPLAHIPYKGTPPAIVDVSSGQVTFMFDQMTAALPLLQAGKLKRLAVTAAKRIALAPAKPTMIEAGVPGFEMSSWQAIYAPKGTPKAIVQRLYAEIAKALKQPDVQAKLGGQLGMEIVGGSPEQLAALMAREIPRWAALVKKSGATAN